MHKFNAYDMVEICLTAINVTDNTQTPGQTDLY